MMTDQERLDHLQQLRDAGKVRDFPFNSNGHSVSSYPSGLKDGDPVPCTCFQQETFGDDPRMWTPIPFGVHIFSECNNCGEHLNFFSVNRNGEIGPEAPCEWIPCETMNIMSITSGKLIIDDDLRDVVFEIDHKAFDSDNSKKGQYDVINAYADIGLTYGPVGNSSPHLYRTGEGSYVIANPAYDEESDDFITHSNWESIGWFCTDLWAYSMTDYGHWLKSGGKPIEEEDQNGTRQVIDFPNGIYMVRHHTTAAGWRGEFERDTIYATINRIE